MYLKKIKLANYRNYEKLEIEFGKNINILIGNNAVGKTNILEAIYVCCITKSHKASKDQELIKFKKDSLSITSEFDKNFIQVNINQKNEKLIFENEIKVKKLCDFIGKNLIVLFSPENMDIIKGYPQKRRRFLDVFISQLSKKYLLNLQEYNKYLQLKNNILKNDIKQRDDVYLDIIDEILAEKSEAIILERMKYIKKLNKHSKKIHGKITNEKEKIKIEYKPDFAFKEKEKIAEILKTNRNYDFNKRTSTKGINHDNILIYIDGEEVSKFGSQGQNRTSLLTLKFAEAKILKEEKDEEPIILLDDVFSELDENRIKYILEFLNENQVFITTTHLEKIGNLKNIKQFEIKKDGIVIEKKS